MKRLLWAGAVALLLHGALLLMKFGSQRLQPPRPLPRGISLTLTAMPQEQPKVTAKNKPPPIEQADKPAVRPPVRPYSRPKPVPLKKAEKAEEEQPVAASAISPVQRQLTTAEPAPSPPQSMGEPQPEADKPADLSAGRQNAGEAEQPAIEATPLYRQNPPPAYPPLARRRGQEGTVQLDVLVNSRGGVNAVRLAETSGHDLLDRAAMAGVQTWLFEPGKRGEQTIDMWVRVPIRYALHD